MNRANVTRIIARHHAHAIDVCLAGSLVALHFATLQGVVIVTADTAEFAEKCRGRLDHNRNLLPDLETAESRKRKAESSDSALPIRALRASKFAGVWEFLQANAHLTIAEAARAAHVSEPGFQQFISRYKLGDQLRAIRAQRGLSLKPQRPKAESRSEVASIE